MYLRGYEGIVEEVLNGNVLRISAQEPKHAPRNTCRKTLRFTGIEEWIGPSLPLRDLVGSTISIYGWEDLNEVVEVLAIARVY